MSSRSIAGVLPVVQTPFDADGRIDAAALEHELAWIKDQRVAGYTTGMVSELLRLTETEREQLAELVVGEAKRYGLLSVIGAGAESTKTAVRLARHAEAAGADGVMVNPPVTVALDEVGLLRYYSEILEGTGIDVVVQDASGYIGRAISIDLQVELLNRYEERIYFKPEAAPIGPRLSQLRDASDGRARIFEGTGGSALIDSHRRGIVGTMPGSEVCWAIQDMWDAAEAGRWDDAYAISGPLSSMIGMQTSIDVFVAVEKHLLVKQGALPSAAVREPSGFVLDAETAAEIDRLFALLRAASAAVRTPVR